MNTHTHTEMMKPRSAYLLDLVEESLLGLLVLALGALEVFVIKLGVELNSGDIDLGGGGNDVSLVDTAEGNTVDLEGSVHEEETGSELLEENNPSAAEATGEEDQHGAGGDVGAQLDGGDLLDLLDVDGGGLSGVEARGLLEGDLALTSVLGTSDLLDLEGLGLLLDLGVGLPLKETTLLVHGGPSEAGHAWNELGVPCLGGHCLNEQKKKEFNMSSISDDSPQIMISSNLSKSCVGVWQMCAQAAVI